MGDQGDDVYGRPVVGLVVPAQPLDVINEWAKRVEAAVVEAVEADRENQRIPSWLAETSGAHPDKCPNRKSHAKSKALRRVYNEAARDLRIAAGELIKAAEYLQDCEASDGPHVRARIEIEPRSWVEFGERTAGAAKQALGWT